MPVKHGYKFSRCIQIRGLHKCLNYGNVPRKDISIRPNMKALSFFQKLLKQKVIM
jgi:hypothetical protein